MPELPDILLYLHALESRIVGKTIERMRIISPFVVRTFDPPIESIEGKRIGRLTRIGKRIVFEIDHTPPLFLVIHLMIAGRFRWSDKPGAKVPGKIALASFEFENGTLHLVESSAKKRASIHLLTAMPALAGMNSLNVNEITLAQFAQQVRRENHTIKRTLTDPRLFDGIGNAYSDEILHAAKLSPIKLTSRLTDDEIARLFDAARSTLTLWIDRLRREFGDRFPGPGEVTAFRPDFAAHGKFGEPCPVCGTKIQRIRYAENETNYCPRCQTDGVVLADRSLSRLLKDDWPRSVEEWER